MRFKSQLNQIAIDIAHHYQFLTRS